MWRRLAASALFGLGLLALTAAGQPPVGGPPAPKPADKKAADPVEGVIAAALANDPDIRIARAKVQLADAELAKARQLVTQRVLTLSAAIQEQKRAVESATELVRLAEQRVKAGAAPQSDLLEARSRLDVARARLAQYETELKLMTGGAAPGAAVGWNDLESVHRGAVWGQSCMACHGTGVRFRATVALAEIAQPRPTGPIPDRLRAALDKKLKLGPNGEKVAFEQALEAFKKDAGLDVPVRAEFKVGPVVSLGEELPVGAWLQLFADGTPNVRILVREYGLLVTTKDFAPPDAISVFDFWKQKPMAKDEPPKK